MGGKRGMMDDMDEEEMREMMESMNMNKQRRGMQGPGQGRKKRSIDDITEEDMREMKETMMARRSMDMGLGEEAKAKRGTGKHMREKRSAMNSEEFKQKREAAMEAKRAQMGEKRSHE